MHKLGEICFGFNEWGTRMKTFLNKFVDSYQAMKEVRTITTCAMFGALSIILGYFTIRIGDFLKIGFSNIVNELTAYLFGPVVGSVFGGAMDILKYILKPTGPFFPGFTITAIVAGLINGIFLYHKTITLRRIFGTQFIIVVFCDMFLNTLWISMLYGKGFLALLPVRVIKNLIMWPISSFLMYLT